MNPLFELFTKTEGEFGLPAGYLERTAKIESNFDPSAKNPNSSASGLFQFINSTAKQYGLKDPFDAVASTNAAARLARDNAATLRRSLGREPTAGELYLAHQQGAGGALKLLRNADRPAEEVVGSAAARLNRGAGMTAGEFAQQWTGKFADLPVSGARTASSAPNATPRTTGLFPPPAAVASAASNSASRFGFDGLTPQVSMNTFRSGGMQGMSAGNYPGMGEFGLQGAQPMNASEIQGGPREMGRMISQGGAFEPMPPNVGGGNVEQTRARQGQAPGFDIPSATYASQGAHMPQQQIDPNQYAGGDWIPPDIGRQLAAQQMGGLGGLGGVANAPDPGAAVAQAQQPMAAPQASQGGGGAMFGNVLQALGASLMSSPSNAPLSGFAQTFQALQAASQGNVKSQQDAQAIGAVLEQAGMPPELINRVINNPQAAKMALEVFQQQQGAEQERSFLGGITGGGQQEAAPPPVLPAQGAPQATGAAPQATGGNRTVEAYTARRQALTDALAAAPTERARKAVEAQIQNLDKQFEVFGSERGFRSATPEEAAGYGSPAGQFGPDGRFYPINPPSGMRIESDGQGGITFVQGSGVTQGGGGNVNENLNAGFVLRGRDSHAIISQFESEGTSMWNKVYMNTPGGVGNYLLTPEGQKYGQAKRDFINASLRRESGAVISPEEFENADQQYFPQPGDYPEVIEQKRKNRENVVKAFEMSAGSAVPPRSEQASPSANDDGWQEIDGVQIRRKAN